MSQLRRTPVDQALVATREVAAHDADRLQLGDLFGDRHQVSHHAERFAAKVGVGAGEDHAHAALGEMRGDFDDAHVEELRFVDGDDIDARRHRRWRAGFPRRDRSVRRRPRRRCGSTRETRLRSARRDAT